MLNEKVLEQIGTEVVKETELPTASLSLNGLNLSIPATEVRQTGIRGTGFLIVEIGNNSAILTLRNNAGTPALTTVTGSTLISTTQGNADTINVYSNNGSIEVQNNTGALAEVLIKSYV